LSRLLTADIFRAYRSKWFWLCLAAMLCMSASFVIMQYTAMDYTVALSRVIFLPMSFFGMIIAALVSLFVGEDFSDGFIRNKIIAGHSRRSIFASNLIASTAACVIIYLVSTLFTLAFGYLLFERDITFSNFILCLEIGIGMCFAYSSIYCTITMLSGNKTTAAVICMALAFSLFCLCLHTNQVMVQPQYKNGVLNPAYVDGILKRVYAFFHDFNPTGQAAQLSTMNIFNAARCVLCDLLWIMTAGVGCLVFRRKNI